MTKDFTIGADNMYRGSFEDTNMVNPINGKESNNITRIDNPAVERQSSRSTVSTSEQSERATQVDLRDSAKLSALVDQVKQLPEPDNQAHVARIKSQVLSDKYTISDSVIAKRIMNLD